MPDTYFSADLHLGHNRIIQYCNRPFKDADHMQEVILENFNSRIKKSDTLYLLGDLAWSSYDLSKFFDRLNTKMVHVVLGNHDKKHPSEYKRFPWVGDYKRITVDSTPVVLFHYPIRSWNHKGRGGIMLYGHCHGTLPGFDRSMDVGVDTHNFYPYSWEEIHNTLKDKPFFGDDPKEQKDSHRRDG